MEEKSEIESAREMSDAIARVVHPLPIAQLVHPLATTVLAPIGVLVTLNYHIVTRVAAR